MYNLEQSIEEWRRQMLTAGIKTPVPLEELEIHLREEIERHTEAGLNKSQAFQAAVDDVAAISMRLLRSLETTAPPKNREEEAAKAKARAAERFGA